MNWYLGVLKQYAVFSGRARRREYWMFTLFNIIAAVVLSAIDGVFGSFSAEAGVGLLSGLYLLAVLLPSIGVSIRRLHDTGRSGWWLLLVLVPVVGPLIVLVFMVLDSQAGSNDYGPNPKAPAVSATAEPTASAAPTAAADKDNPGLFRE
ncbi:DUF805 domain-containing protein [Flagellatimonas centrodinii]|uniref:DUF805 domain-containing protein n=1 Tax=Flagellatimonas centrodinii TaxID=2806210 RepID=UPI001FEF90B8|nr:DUF805 domain-containing protein [Flagellatimonas centrodinii]ULQ48128.1 DUF805 domain-containing protein [Flagellatimonas centrodinii]